MNGLTLKDMFDELRRLEDCVLYFQNKVLRQQIALDQFFCLAERLETPEPPPAKKTLGPRQRISDELLDQTIAKYGGNYDLTARALHYNINTIYRRRPGGPKARSLRA